MADEDEQEEPISREPEAGTGPPRGVRRRLVVSACVAAVVAAGVLAVDFADKGGDDENSDSERIFFPEGGAIPQRQITGLKEAAAAAGCRLSAPKVSSREHVDGKVGYPTEPPAGGDHFQVPAADGVYAGAPPSEALAHSLEHGRIVVWADPKLSADDRANLKTLFDRDPLQQVLTPDPSGMRFAVAATAWNRDPEPLGTGRLLGCPKMNDAVFEAIAAFRDEHRGNGPEDVP